MCTTLDQHNFQISFTEDKQINVEIAKWPETVEPRACKIKETGNATYIWLHQGQIKGQYPISYGTSNHDT
jgi:hypothetical protein